MSCDILQRRLLWRRGLEGAEEARLLNDKERLQGQAET